MKRSLLLTLSLIMGVQLHAQHALTNANTQTAASVNSTIFTKTKNHLLNRSTGTSFRYQDLQHYFWLNDSFWMQMDSSHYTYYPNGSTHIITKYVTDYSGKNHPHLKYTYEYIAATAITSSEQLARWDIAKNTWVDTLRTTFSYTSRDDFAQKTIETYDTIQHTWIITDGIKYDYQYDNAGKVTQLITSKYEDNVWKPKHGLHLIYNNQGLLERDTFKAYHYTPAEITSTDSLVRVYTNNAQGECNQVSLLMNQAGSWIELYRINDISWNQYTPEKTDWIREEMIENSWVNRGTYKSMVVQISDGSGGYINIARNSLDLPDAFGSVVLTQEVYENNQWVFQGRESHLNDEHSQQLLYKSEMYNAATGWSTQAEKHYANTYDTNGNITMAQESALDGSGQFKDTYRTVYTNYITFNSTGFSKQPIPVKVALYPNPTNGQSNLTLSLEDISNVSIDVLNSLGQKVASLVEPTQIGSGNYLFQINTPSSGLYIVRITVNGQTTGIKLIHH